MRATCSVTEKENGGDKVKSEGRREEGKNCKNDGKWRGSSRERSPEVKEYTASVCVCEGVWSLGDSARSLTRRFWGLIELAERTAECSDWGLCHPLKQQLFVDPSGLHPHLHHHHHPHRRPSHGDEGPVTQRVMEVEWEDPVIQHFAVPFKADIYICFF